MIERIIAELMQSYDLEHPEKRYGNQLFLNCPADRIIPVLDTLKQTGFNHLNVITAVDWIKQGIIEVRYILWSYTHKIHWQISCRVNREDPKVPSIHRLWGQAQVLEREVHEFFGVTFLGNPDLSPLFLHNWHDLPPLRKNFNTDDFVDAMFIDDYERAVEP